MRRYGAETLEYSWQKILLNVGALTKLLSLYDKLGKQINKQVILLFISVWKLFALSLIEIERISFNTRSKNKRFIIFRPD